MELRQLSELIPAWPDTAPQSLAELVFADNDVLDGIAVDEHVRELVLQLRGHVRAAARQRGQSAQLWGPEAVQAAFADGDLVLVNRRWLTLALDRHRRRTFVAYSSDSARTVSKVSRFVPDADDLPTLPEDGAYLVLWGGTPDVLEIEDVRVRLQDMQRRAPIVDVLFRKRDRRESTLWSLRQGFGCRGFERIEFPNEQLMKEVRLWS